jgi:hypothetical protein
VALLHREELQLRRRRQVPAGQIQHSVAVNRALCHLTRRWRVRPAPS